MTVLVRRCPLSVREMCMDVEEVDPYPAPSIYEPCRMCGMSIARGRTSGWDNPSNSDLPLPPPCTHWFCSDCLRAYASVGGRTCPTCESNWGAFLYARYGWTRGEDPDDPISEFTVSAGYESDDDDAEDADPISESY